MVFWSFWLCRTTGWTFGINDGRKITNVAELKYRQHFSGPWKPDRMSE